MALDQGELLIVNDPALVVCTADFCSTECVVKKYSIGWIIGSKVASDSINIRSTPFYIGKLEACFDLWPVGKEDGKTQWTFFLQILSTFDSIPRGKMSLKYDDYVQKGHKEILLDSNTFTQDHGFGIGFEMVENRFKYRFDCTVWHVDVDEILQPPPVHLLTLSSDYLKLLKNDEFSDVTLKVGGEVLKAHKNILASRSPVFAAMLKADMTESRSGEIVIQDIEVAVMKMLLSFIYSGRVKEDDEPLDEDTAMKLLRAADKYDIPELKAMCSEALVRIMAVENVAGLLKFAIVHNDHHLKTKTMHFIRSNMRKVTETEGWKLLKKYHSDIAIELLGGLAQ